MPNNLKSKEKAGANAPSSIRGSEDKPHQSSSAQAQKNETQPILPTSKAAKLKRFLPASFINSAFFNEIALPYHFCQAAHASRKYHHPARNLHVIGVTGTNGKTTTAFMIWKMLNSAGLKTGLTTTVAWGVDKLEPELGHMTTADAETLNSRIRKIADADAEFLVLEVTSHALAEFRTLGIPFEIAVFTNLTHEHLDYHKTMSRYAAAKAKLFRKAKFSIINADDPHADFFKAAALRQKVPFSATPSFPDESKKYITYGLKNGKIRAFSPKLSVSGVNYSLRDINPTESEWLKNSPGDIKTKDFTTNKSLKIESALERGFPIETKIPGEFNISNSLAAALVGLKLGLTPKQVQQGIKSLTEVEGRMNLINEGQNFTVIVDYAHAPDALEKVFDSLGEHKGRVISVHGGAGRRDPSTRPIRGAILAKNSDIVIITEDDSRDEDPQKIAQGFVEGAEKAGRKLNKDLFVELNREKAIEKALKMAKKDDIVLLLGKGHEKTILRADGPHPFIDADVARKILKDL